MMRMILTASMVWTLTAAAQAEAAPKYKPQVTPKYKYNPLATGSTPGQRVLAPTPTPTPRPIPFQQLRWVDPGPYRPSGTANYGAGTSKSGPDGQRLRVHPVPYMSGSGGPAPIVAPPRYSPPPAGTPRPKKNFGYDENRPKVR